MHLLARDSRTLDEEQRAEDLGHAPADLVLLSFADSDLGAAAVAWQELAEPRPSLRLANLARLRHPMSVDLYAERVVTQARCVLVRLLGGLEYWRYGAEEFAATCRRAGVALALLPGDARNDARLAELSTVPGEDWTRLDAYLREGGPQNLVQALRLAARLGGLDAGAPAPPQPVPVAGEHPLGLPTAGDLGLAVLVFYRAHLLAGDIAPVMALAEALHAQGFGVRALHVASLKDAAIGDFVADRLAAWRPVVVVNATAFSATQGTAGSPLDAAGVPVLQVVLAGSTREAWAGSTRGLTQADLAMQVVLPELDGRLLTTTVSFKAEAAPIAGLDFARTIHQPDADGVALAAARARGWAVLAGTPPAARRVAMVLSDYPGAGGGQVGHAVGLDTFASLDALLSLLAEAGYDTGGPSSGAASLANLLGEAPPAPVLDLATYQRLFATLPDALRTRIDAAWGPPDADPACIGGAFHLRHARRGALVLAVQPDRGTTADRRASYHDPDLPPRHAYVAFYLWLRETLGMQALLHLGTHGTLEWLPGKAVALSPACAPAALTGGLPVIYPFIVNNPGEAAARRHHHRPPDAAATPRRQPRRRYRVGTADRRIRCRRRARPPPRHTAAPRDTRSCRRRGVAGGKRRGRRRAG